MNSLMHAGSNHTNGAGKRRAIYAELPESPVTTSPVPRLTSLYHHNDAGHYGDRRYPGNCGGILIRDLLVYFRAKRVFDPMSGSGTCRHVCQELGVSCLSTDLRSGFDACNPRQYDLSQRFDFIWLHPPYWRQKVYSDDARDMSACPTLRQFCDCLTRLLASCAKVLAHDGKLALLMGDYTDRHVGFVPLVYHSKRICYATGLRQVCTDIIRFVHRAGSAGKVYRSSFIPGLHDVCMIFEKRAAQSDRGHAPR
jgi:hypothetical protein